MTSWSTTGLYGFTWDVGYDVMDMAQIRNTYPLPGFRILVASFASALADGNPLDARSFVGAYAESRFGLDERDAELLWQFLMAPPALIDFGNTDLVHRVTAMRAAYAPIRDAIRACTPVRNGQEFEHFKLMADLRMHYLDYKLVEAQANATDFTPAQAPTLLSALDEVLADARQLDARFDTLMAGFLYPAEIDEQNWWRAKQAHVLHDRLAKLKGTEYR